MKQISKFSQSFALVLFATTAAINLATEESPHEKLKYLEKEQHKNTSWYRTIQKTVAEYWFPVTAVAGAFLVSYLYSYDKSDKQNSNLPKNVLGPDAYKTLCALYATYFVTVNYIDNKVAKPFAKKQEKERKAIAKAMEKLRKEMLKS